MSSCSIDVAPEQLCYIPCNFCNIVLAVSLIWKLFYNLVGDLIFSSCMLPNWYDMLLVFKCQTNVQHTHTHTHLVVFFFCLFVFFHLFTSKDKRTQSDPEKEATLGVCVFALLWTSGCVILIPSFWVPSFCYSHVSISGLFFFPFFSFFCSQRKVIPWRTSRWSHTQTQKHMYTYGVFPFSFWVSAGEANCANCASKLFWEIWWFPLENAKIGTICWNCW